MNELDAKLEQNQRDMDRLKKKREGLLKQKEGLDKYHVIPIETHGIKEVLVPDRRGYHVTIDTVIRHPSFVGFLYPRGYIEGAPVLYQNPKSPGQLYLNALQEDLTTNLREPTYPTHVVFRKEENN